MFNNNLECKDCFLKFKNLQQSKNHFMKFCRNEYYNKYENMNKILYNYNLEDEKKLKNKSAYNSMDFDSIINYINKANQDFENIKPKILKKNEDKNILLLNNYNKNIKSYNIKLNDFEEKIKELIDNYYDENKIENIFLADNKQFNDVFDKIYPISHTEYEKKNIMRNIIIEREKLFELEKNISLKVKDLKLLYDEYKINQINNNFPDNILLDRLKECLNFLSIQQIEISKFKFKIFNNYENCINSNKNNNSFWANGNKIIYDIDACKNVIKNSRVKILNLKKEIRKLPLILNQSTENIINNKQITYKPLKQINIKIDDNFNNNYEKLSFIKEFRINMNHNGLKNTLKKLKAEATINNNITYF